MFLRVPAAILLILILAYGAFKAWPLISGPLIRLDTPAIAADGSEVMISGRAIHTETLTLDGGILLIDKAGRFSTTLTLPRGGSILTLTATDRFGRSRTEQKELIIP